MSPEGLKDLEMWGPRILVFTILISHYLVLTIFIVTILSQQAWHIALEAMGIDTILKYFSKGEKESQAESPNPATGYLNFHTI